MSDSTGFDIEALFLNSRHGRLFCVYRAPLAPKAGIVYVHPFAEEMHKSRRMAALQARRLAQMGCAVLHVDLLGCGDSEGDFGDASWAIWRDCVIDAYAWLAARAPGPLYVWGLRLGAALAAEVSTELPALAGLLLWQPVANGESFLNQFLRIKLAAEMLGEGKSQTGTKELRRQLGSGEAVEVGGYRLAPGLAMGIDALRLGKLPVRAPVRWLDVAAELSPASAAVATAWANGGTPVAQAAVAGEPFWVTQEITECPNLLDATTQAFAEMLP
ncbi:MAG: hydrolase 2, exosortase A system-associated [Candidatus Methylumidiphilus sp.]